MLVFAKKMSSQEVNEYSNLPIWVKTGDILLIQKPFKDETKEDYTTLPGINELQINHTALVTDTTSEKCISHSVTEGFNFPTCRNTKIWNGTFLVIRCNDDQLTRNAATICRKWCSGIVLIDQKTYLELYAHYRLSQKKTKKLKKI